MKKPKVGFICVHNSCRSQMAEALGKLLVSDTFDSYSAGTEFVPQINQEAVKTILELYHYDMSHQISKTMDKIPPLDIIITMGCNVNCPTVPCCHREDWGLDDPTGKDIVEYENTAKIIEKRILNLKERIRYNQINLAQYL